MSIQLQFRGATEAVTKLRTYPAALQEMVALRAQDLARKTSENVKAKLSGELLNVKSGRLRGSIYGRAYITQNKITIAVGSRGGVPYAGIQEDGGTIRPHAIEAKVGGLLVWQQAGKKRAAPVVQHPGAVIRGVGYLSSSTESTASDLRQILMDAKTALRNGN